MASSAQVNLASDTAATPKLRHQPVKRLYPLTAGTPISHRRHFTAVIPPSTTACSSMFPEQLGLLPAPGQHVGTEVRPQKEVAVTDVGR